MREYLIKGQFAEVIKISDDIQRLSDYTFYLIDDIMQSVGSNKRNNIAFALEERKIHEDLIFCFDILKILLKMRKFNSSISTCLNIPEEANLFCIQTDSIRLRQIIINLISNAVKFTKSGYITLNAKIINVNNIYTFEISICDSGIGMKPDVLKKLFKNERVVDLEINKEFNKTGTGAGLNIAHNLCELMGYSIECESKLNEGTTMKIYIPAYRSLIDIVKESNHNHTWKENNTCLREELEIIKEEDLCSDLDKSYSIKNSKINSSASISNIKLRFQDELLTPSNSIIRKKSCFDKKNSYSPNVQNNTSQVWSNIIELKKVAENDNDETRINNIIPDLRKTGSIQSKQNSFLFRTNNLTSSRGTILSNSISLIKQNSRNYIKSPSFEAYFPNDSPKNKKSNINSLNNITSSTSSSSKPQILICDDSQIIRNSLMKNIYSIEDINKTYSIETCFDGVEALFKIVNDQSKGNFIKALFFDENMEYMGGTETIKKLKKLEEDQKIKNVIYISISANDESMTEQAKVYDYVLSKPITKTKLSECLLVLKLLP